MSSESPKILTAATVSDMKRKLMDPKAKRQLVKSVFDFLISIASIAGAEAADVIEEGIEKWLKIKTPKPKPAKKRKRRKKFNTTARPWSIRPESI